MKKVSLLAASVTLALTLVGCGSSDDDSNDPSTNIDTEKTQKPSIAIPTAGKFIDAKVIGLDYISGSLEEKKTDINGTYTIDTNNPEISFYLGGKDGLFIGSISGRHITTPFEAAGTYQRAVNLARLLLTVGEGTSTLIKTGQAVLIKEITLPQDLSVAATELKEATLDDEASLLAVATALNPAITALVSQDDATTHMQSSLANIPRGSDVNLSHWSRGSNWTFVSRDSTQRIRNSANQEFDLVINVDRTLTDSQGNPRNLFEKTSSMIFTLADNNLIVRKGSNDSSISGHYVADYLTCLDNDGIFNTVETDGNEYNTCDGNRITVTDERYNYFYNLDNKYQYSFISPNKEQISDINEPWIEISEMGDAFECMNAKNCTEQALSKFEVLERDDSDEQDGSYMLEETISGTYDPITDVYINTTSKKYLDNSPYPGRISERISFLYPVEALGQDRYVDFIGTWESRELCANKSIAVAKMTFTETGLTMTGEECGTLGFINKTHTYAQLSPKDLWWFGTNDAGDSKATLDQLNSTVRWNDKNSTDDPNNIKINRFTYIPAGKNWDQGLLIRDTLNLDGTKKSTITMKKIKSL